MKKWIVVFETVATKTQVEVDIEPWTHLDKELHESDKAINAARAEWRQSGGSPRAIVREAWPASRPPFGR